MTFESKTNAMLYVRSSSTHIPRVPEFLSPRPNWESPTPLPQASVPFPPLVRGWGSRNSDEGRDTVPVVL